MLKNWKERNPENTLAKQRHDPENTPMEPTQTYPIMLKKLCFNCQSQPHGQTNLRRKSIQNFGPIPERKKKLKTLFLLRNEAFTNHASSLCKRLERPKRYTLEHCHDSEHTSIGSSISFLMLKNYVVLTD